MRARGILYDVSTESQHAAAPGAPEGAGPPRDLVALGFSERLEALFAPLADDGLISGRVSRVDRGQPLVLTAEGALRAELAAHLRGSTDAAIAVGDWVALARPEGHDLAIVEAVLPRTSAFTRKDPGDHAVEQVVVANVDTVFVVQSLAPRGPNLARLERELVLAWESGARPAVLLTKPDLVDDPEALRAEAATVALGVDLHVVCPVTGDGFEVFSDYLGPGRTVAFFGASGVGKSTIVNRLVGTDVQETAEVRDADGKGRHTTVAREMFFLPGGGIVIDTPGMRALALWNAEEGIAAAFPDIEEFAAGCRFADCAHTVEPGCAVRAAVEEGTLPARRLESYLALRDELERLAVKQDARARAEKHRADKVFGRLQKNFYKHRGR